MRLPAPLAGLLLIVAGCSWLDQPDPLDYPYDWHRVVFHTTVIDSSAGTGDFRPHFSLELSDAEFRRPGCGSNVFTSRIGTMTIQIDSFADPDTVDTFSIAHFAGLAQSLDGDTSHFARLDSRPGWEWFYRCRMTGRYYGQDGEKRFTASLPDTVTSEVHLLVEVVWPWVHEYDRYGQIHYNLDYLRITRIDAN